MLPNIDELKHLYRKLQKNITETSEYTNRRHPDFKTRIEELQERGKDLALSIKEKLNLYSISGFLAKEDMKYVKEVFSTIAEENLDLLSSYEIIQLIDYKDEAISELLFKLQTTENQEEKSNLFSEIISLTNGVSPDFVQLACSKKEKEEFRHQLGNDQPEDNSIEDLLIKLKKVGEDKQQEVVEEIILILSDKKKYGIAYHVKVLQAISDFNNGSCADYIAGHFETQKQIFKRYFYRPFLEIKKAILTHVENNNYFKANGIKKLPQHIQEAINNRNYVEVFKLMSGVQPKLDISKHLQSAINLIEFLQNDKEKYEVLKAILQFQDMYQRFDLVKIARQIPSYTKNILEILSPKDNKDCSLCKFIEVLLEDKPTKDEIDYAVEIFLKIKASDEVLEQAFLSIHPHISKDSIHEKAVIDHINQYGDEECKRYLLKKGIPLLYQQMIIKEPQIKGQSQSIGGFQYK